MVAVLVVAALLLSLRSGHDVLALLLVGVALVVALVAWLETGPDSAKEVALVATLAGAAAAGRVLFTAIPGVQPVTVIVVATGVGLGLRAGVAVGALAPLVSNFFLVQGPWTPWQMLLWAACGAAGAGLAPLLRGRLAFVVTCFVLGLTFSGLMDVWNWWYALPHTAAALAATLVRGFSFDLAHGIGNVVIALIAGPELGRLLARYARRLHTEVVWA